MRRKRAYPGTWWSHAPRLKTYPFRSIRQHSPITALIAEERQAWMACRCAGSCSAKAAVHGRALRLARELRATVLLRIADVGSPAELEAAFDAPRETVRANAAICRSLLRGGSA
jgi:hypothetical protein